MMRLMEPWIFSVQLASHVTVLSCRTPIQWWHRCRDSLPQLMTSSDWILFFSIPLFGILSSSLEQSWKLSPKISNAFLVVIQQAVAILIDINLKMNIFAY
ncbi:hypothetical protein ILYODFUR_006868 [Ilyodon furcidens]|uniref:Uncharacterized protein n=1 Tax=Ilyodon furcidens TaxID=33524 RepID=A0ABV0TJH0_9TELE